MSWMPSGFTKCLATRRAPVWPTTAHPAWKKQALFAAKCSLTLSRDSAAIGDSFSWTSRFYPSTVNSLPFGSIRTRRRVFTNVLDTVCFPQSIFIFSIVPLTFCTSDFSTIRAVRYLCMRVPAWSSEIRIKILPKNRSCPTVATPRAVTEL